MPRTKRPASAKEKSGVKDDVLKNFGKIGTMFMNLINVKVLKSCQVVSSIRYMSRTSKN